MLRKKEDLNVRIYIAHKSIPTRAKMQTAPRAASQQQALDAGVLLNVYTVTHKRTSSFMPMLHIQIEFAM